MSIGTLLIRADASISMGTGHAMRCLALAQAWQDAGGNAIFAMAESTEAVRSRLATEYCEIVKIASSPASSEDIQQTLAIARDRSCEWIVVDGYQFGSDYQSGLKASGLKILFLDDYGHARQYPADVVLNQSIAASPSHYTDRSQHTRLLLGPRYAMLRREFAAWRDWRRTITPLCGRVLVTMGGSDEHNVTSTVVQALCHSEGFRTTVLMGGSNPHLTELKSQIVGRERDIEFRTNVRNVGELMARSDIAVSAVGSTCWELCLLSLPSLLIDIAENQTLIAKEMERHECAIHLGDRTVKPQAVSDAINSLSSDSNKRRRLSENSRTLVDGRGAARVVSLLTGSAIMQLRHATEEDSRLLWEWANDPEVRIASFSSDPISWESHLLWFEGKQADSRNAVPKCRMFIAENEEGLAAGQIRFERRLDSGWNVGVSLSRQFRGSGFGSLLIRRGLRELLKYSGSSAVHAYVKPENIGSIKAFERADFQRIGIEQVCGHSAVHLIYQS